MARAPILRCIVSILALASAESNHRRGLSINGESKDLVARLGRVEHKSHVRNPHLRQRRKMAGVENNPVRTLSSSPTDSPAESPTLPTTPSPTILTTPSPTNFTTLSPTILSTLSPTNSTGETMPTTDPGSSPTQSPGDFECRSGESLLQLYFETDQSSGSENQLLLWDIDAPADEWIWIVGLNEFESNTVHNGYACLLPSRCYQFAFSDEWGDGLVTGGLRLIQDGELVFQINPGDMGATLAEGSPVSYWLKDIGAC